MKLSQLVNEAFVKSLNDLAAKELPAALAYRVSKTILKAAEEQKEYWRLRGEMITKYVLKNEDGTHQTKDGPNGEKFLIFGEHADTVDKELLALGDQEVDIPKVKVEDLIKSGLSISAGQIQDLEPILQE